MLPVPRGLRGLLVAVREGKGWLPALAVAVGAGAGLGAIVFRWLIQTFTLGFSGHPDYAAAGPAANPLLPGLGRWFVVLAPAVGGLLYGPLVDRFAREARGHGVPEVMYAVAERGGRIAPQVSVVKALASALCIGSGGSVGREGPIVQIGAALGSTLGRVVRVADERLRILVACGAAGGIAATFNAPLAGVFFAMELILRDFTADAFGVVVLSSVTASAVGRAAFGNTAFLHLPAFTLRHPVEYLLFAALGLLAGAVGVLFTRVLYLVEDVFDRLWRGPEWLRPGVGGLLLGGLLLVLPQMYGVGYPVLEGAIDGRFVLWFLLLLGAGKILATSLTIGMGGSGGVFAPSLFVGAMLGTAYGLGVHQLLPGVTGPAGAYGLVGMGAVFAGAARAPITAVLVLFELTGEYSIILPMMAAIVFATLASRTLSRDTIYTLKLRRRGIDLEQPAPATLRRGRVRDVMDPLPPVLDAGMPLTQAPGELSRSPYGMLPVVDGGAYRGTVTARAVAETLSEGDAPGRTVGDLAMLPTTVDEDTDLAAALGALMSAKGTGLPVLDATHRQVVGWVTHQNVLTALVAGAASPSPRDSGPPQPAAPRPPQRRRGGR